jgi:hypothetical protein
MPRSAARGTGHLGRTARVLCQAGQGADPWHLSFKLGCMSPAIVGKAPQMSILDFMFLMSCFLYNRISPALCHVALISDRLHGCCLPSNLRCEHGTPASTELQPVVVVGDPEMHQQGQGFKVARLPDHTSTFLWSHTQISLATCKRASMCIRTNYTKARNSGGFPICAPLDINEWDATGSIWHLVDEPEVVGHQHHAALEVVDGVRQRVDGLQVQMVCRLIQQQLQDQQNGWCGPGRP